MSALFQKIQVGQDQPAFSYSSKQCITYVTFTKRLKQLLRAAGLSPELFSGHSFRRGGATFLHDCGETAMMVQASVDWTSQCFTRYLYLTEAQRLVSQRLMMSRINSQV